MLQKVSDFNAPSTIFWLANANNARNQVTQETLGNGVVTNSSFDAVTGWLSSVTSGVGAATNLQNESYLRDLVGNVIQRQNNNVGLTENFYYDNLYRLDHSTLGAVQNLALTYDAMGNITSRTDLAGNTTWAYHSTKKHAVTQAGTGVGSFAYTYDNNGNVTGRNGYAITWTSFNHPSQINSNGESVSFDYNQDHERWRAVYNGSAGIETTYFIGGLLEKAVMPGSVADYRHFIAVGEMKVAVYSRLSTGTNTLRYIREDHQGSVVNILNSDGTSYVKESFTAFGKRRSSCTWSGDLTQGNKDKINAVTRHGYTWHTALGEMGLNDMNGRIQDALTGRFLSADPYIQDAANTQSYNRYSYVVNNPLTLTDPSGFEGIDDPRVSGVLAFNIPEVTISASRPTVLGPDFHSFTESFAAQQQRAAMAVSEAARAALENAIGAALQVAPLPTLQKEPPTEKKEQPPQREKRDSKFREHLDKCVQDKVGTLGWALDGVTSLAGLDTDFQGTLTENYGDFVDFAAVGLPVGQWLAQPRVRAGTAAGRMIQGEVSGARAGAYVGRALGGRAGMVPLMRAGRLAGGVASRVLAVPAAFAGGYVAGAVASCSVEYAVGGE